MTSWQDKQKLQHRNMKGDIRKLAGRYQQTNKPIKDKEGMPLTTVREQLSKWTEHFSKLLYRSTPEDPPDIPPAETHLPINTDELLRN